MCLCFPFFCSVGPDLVDGELIGGVFVGEGPELDGMEGGREGVFEGLIVDFYGVGELANDLNIWVTGFYYFFRGRF